MEKVMQELEVALDAFNTVGAADCDLKEANDAFSAALNSGFKVVEHAIHRIRGSLFDDTAVAAARQVVLATKSVSHRYSVAIAKTGDEEENARFSSLCEHSAQLFYCAVGKVLSEIRRRLHSPPGDDVLLDPKRILRIQTVGSREERRLVDAIADKARLVNKHYKSVANSTQRFSREWKEVNDFFGGIVDDITRLRSEFDGLSSDPPKDLVKAIKTMAFVSARNYVCATTILREAFEVSR